MKNKNNAERKTVLVAHDGHSKGANIHQYLSSEYNSINADGLVDCLRIMREKSSILSAVIVDSELLAQDNYAFLDTVTQDEWLSNIPVIAASREALEEHNLECLTHGAYDILYPPYRADLVNKRVENAINSSHSRSLIEIEEMLSVLPSHIFLKNTEGRYVFATHYWHQIERGKEDDWTIYGKTDPEIRKDKDNARRALETDLEVVRTGEGTEYVIEVDNDGSPEFMQIIKRAVFDKDGNVTGVISLANDVTETEMLKRELDRSAHIDVLTGLGNRRAFNELVRSLSDRLVFPIAVITADCDDLKGVNDNYGHLVGDEYIRETASILTDCIPETARAFRLGGDEFVALVPHSNKESAKAILKSLKDQNGKRFADNVVVNASYGFNILNSADEDFREAIRCADEMMYEDKGQ